MSVRYLSSDRRKDEMETFSTQTVNFDDMMHQIIRTPIFWI